ncbi:MAG: DUF86 domain-containing protein [Rhodospirillales bacterium]|nr:DUF86 domain-containing protein [Rhodospirillales bacterium]
MRDDKERLRDIFQSIEDIQTFISGISKAQFLKIEKTDRKTFRAVCDCISTLGEAVKKLSPEITEKNDSIDWTGLAGMKDIVTHQYFRVHLDLVWNTITQELSDLKEFVEAELSAK